MQQWYKIQLQEAMQKNQDQGHVKNKLKPNQLITYYQKE